ncbi:MAG: alpha/beta hydrolase [Candidatus Sumerlaeota bacterium]|nr:alpha/beta hydrolase [Candidatus Sumerlaeota bacterium]
MIRRIAAALTILILALAAWLPAAEPATKAERAAKRTPKATTSLANRMPTDLKVIKDIVFKQVDDAKLDLMLFQPLETKYEKAPLVVYIHGGGWGGGDKYKILANDHIGVVRELNKQGVACASIEYRLADGGKATAMDSVADCMDAIAWLVKHAADYGLDPARVATYGSSAGGHLSLVTALGNPADYPCDPSFNDSRIKVRCEVAYYPATTFLDAEPMKGSNFERPQRLIPILGGPIKEKRDVAAKLSPVELMTKDSPPVLLVHGLQDKVLSYKFSTFMRDRAKEIGAPVECILVQGADHGFRGEAIQPSLEEICQRSVEFFLKHLTEGL